VKGTDNLIKIEASAISNEKLEKELDKITNNILKEHKSFIDYDKAQVLADFDYFENQLKVNFEDSIERTGEGNMQTKLNLIFKIKELETLLLTYKITNTKQIGEIIDTSTSKTTLIIVVAFVTSFILSIFLVFFMQFIKSFKEESND